MESFKGKTVKGKGIGRKFGFPTLNVPYPGEDNGVFVGRVKIGDVWEKAAINVGSSPTVGSIGNMSESYLIDWNGVVREGTEIYIELLEKIRETKKFDSLEDLKVQISKDVEFVKNWYTCHRNLV